MVGKSLSIDSVKRLRYRPLDHPQHEHHDREDRSKGPLLEDRQHQGQRANVGNQQQQSPPR